MIYKSKQEQVQFMHPTQANILVCLHLMREWIEVEGTNERTESDGGMDSMLILEEEMRRDGKLRSSREETENRGTCKSLKGFGDTWSGQ